MRNRCTKAFFWTLALLAMSTALLWAGEPEVVTGGTDGEKTCHPAPRVEGFWHSECVETPAAKGGIGGGKLSPQEKSFMSTILPKADALLKEKLGLASACVDGVGNDSPENECGTSLRRYTALLFNVASGRLNPDCELKLEEQGCASLTVGDAMDELAGLIRTGKVKNCSLASMCAAAVNDGTAFDLENY